MSKVTDYGTMLSQLTGLVSTERDTIANLANASAAINMNMADLNWVGFYIVKDGMLVLGPFQGKAACIRIPFGKGVCGNAAKDDTTLLVRDVHEFKGHIACDCDSNSEIVIPMHKDGRVVAVLDIDSPVIGRFTEDDKANLEKCAKVLEESCNWDDVARV